MRTCGTPVATANLPEFYSLRRLATKSVPQTINQLGDWLSKQHREGNWDAKLYVAKSAYWNSAPPEFRQTGCSPNYNAGWWTLACCKHDMRRTQPFRRRVKDYKIPTFVFTLASKGAWHSQALVSVAKVTHHFETMKEYAAFVLETRNQTLISSRLTRVHKNDQLLGWRFGDCHSDEHGKVGAPDRDHVHGKGCWDHGKPCWKVDNDGTHLILASDAFLIWDHPVFIARKLIMQSGQGRNIAADNFANTFSRK